MAISSSSRIVFTLVALAASSARAEGGSVAGKVDVTPAKYTAETVVYLKGVKGTAAPRSHAMDQKTMSFVPHVLAIARGDTVKFLNHDGVAHNVYSPDGDAYNLGTFKSNEERDHTFEQEGAYTQLCSIHPEMLGFIFVAPSPYAAVPDAKGHYAIKDVPPGSYQLAVWNSHLKAPDRPVTVQAGKTTQLDVAVKR